MLRGCVGGDPPSVSRAGRGGGNPPRWVQPLADTLIQYPIAYGSSAIEYNQHWSWSMVFQHAGPVNFAFAEPLNGKSWITIIDSESFMRF